MRLLKLVMAYDGTAYVGWQRQPNGPSVQALLEDALAPIAGAPVTVHGAGRTDAGVHALGQVASVSLTTRLDAPALVRALNATLPPDIRVLAASEETPGFHARYSATAKRYRYYLHTGPVVSPFAHRYVWPVANALDEAAMADALDALVGRHDFAAFQAAGSGVATTERTVSSAHVEAAEPVWVDSTAATTGGRLLAVELESDGFLRHMVRNVVGTLVEVGQRRRAAGDVRAILQSRDRRRAGPTAPARGLFLVGVRYAPAR